jgi:hypothetical protein
MKIVTVVVLVICPCQNHNARNSHDNGGFEDIPEMSELLTTHLCLHRLEENCGIVFIFIRMSRLSPR